MLADKTKENRKRNDYIIYAAALTWYEEIIAVHRQFILSCHFIVSFCMLVYLYYYTN
jgi:hypothetical protein